MQPEYDPIIVIGPECSGTKITTKLFIEAGLFGDDDHEQRLDPFIEGKVSYASVAGICRCVMRRSIPHGDVWVDFSDLQRRLKEEGKSLPFFVITMRDWNETIRSKVRNQFHGSHGDALSAMRREMTYLSQFIPQFENWCIFGTSRLFASPERAIKSLALSTGIDLKVPITLYDADEKYF